MPIESVAATPALIPHELPQAATSDAWLILFDLLSRMYPALNWF